MVPQDMECSENSYSSAASEQAASQITCTEYLTELDNESDKENIPYPGQDLSQMALMHLLLPITIMLICLEIVTCGRWLLKRIDQDRCLTSQLVYGMMPHPFSSHQQTTLLT